MSDIIFEQIYLHSSSGIAVVLLQEGAMIRCNPALCRMFGYTEDELTGLCYGDHMMAGGEYTSDPSSIVTFCCRSQERNAAKKSGSSAKTAGCCGHSFIYS